MVRGSVLRSALDGAELRPCKRIAGNVTPYAALHYFHGVVHWRAGRLDFQGGDAHNFQVLGGASLRLGAGFEAFAEGALGARAVSAGVSRAF